LPAALPKNDGHRKVKVEIVQTQAGHLCQADTGVDHEAEQRGIPSILESLTFACLEEPPKVLIRSDRYGLIGHLGGMHPCHRG